MPASPTARLDRFLEEVYLSHLDRDPALRERVGFEESRTGWDDRSPTRAAIDRVLLERELARLRTETDSKRLDEEGLLSYRLFVFEAERGLARFDWRDHAYLVLPGEGVHLTVPRTLVRGHSVLTLGDAEDYILRLRASRRFLDELVDDLLRRRDRGHLAPHFAYSQVAAECRDALDGAPFQVSAPDGVVLADFRAKVGALPDLDDEVRDRLIERAEEALLDSVRPAYERLIATLVVLGDEAVGDHGAWNLPDGDSFYAHALLDATTLPLTPSALHELALAEVARIHDQMLQILRQLDHPKGLPSFFEFLREDRQFFAANDREGRAELLALARSTLTAIEARIEELVPLAPRTKLTIEALARPAVTPAYRAGDPSVARPATWSVDLTDTRNTPRYLVQAIVYRETMPGRHLRTAITAELEGAPSLRRALVIPAWADGWDLYAASLPLELGLFEDPYANFGRLAEALWAASLLVVDTGLHQMRWSRSEAETWLTENTANPEAMCARAVEAVLLHPGAAAAAPVGMIRLVEMRDEAERRLDLDFDLRAFHGVVLGAGPVPLDILEQRVDEWTERK